MITLLEQAHLPETMWGDTLRLPVCIINATLTSALPNMTPCKAWHGHKPELRRLYTFGCTAYIQVQKEDRNGLQPRTCKSIYKGWCCLDPITKCTFILCDIIFDESKVPGLSTLNPISQGPLPPIPTPLPREAAIPPDVTKDQQNLNPAPEPPIENHEDQPISCIPDPPHLTINEPHCSSRNTSCINYPQLHDLFL